MEKWDDAIKFCQDHYKNCYECPIRGACYEDHREDRRSAKEYENDIIKAINELKKK